MGSGVQGAQGEAEAAEIREGGGLLVGWVGGLRQGLGWRIMDLLRKGAPGRNRLRTLAFLQTPGPSLTISLFTSDSCPGQTLLSLPKPPFLNTRWESLGEPLTCRRGQRPQGSTEGPPHPGSISVNTRSSHQPC